MKITELLGEATEYDKKQAVETKKPKSWLKTVSAFANGSGGILVFGVADNDDIIGLTDIKSASEFVSQKIKERIAGMDHWTDKQETRAAVDVLIRNVLYEEIPDSMFDRLEAYRKAIYEHIYTHYKQAA